MTQKSIDVKKAAHLQPGLRFPARSLNYLFDDTVLRYRSFFIAQGRGGRIFISCVSQLNLLALPPRLYRFLQSPLTGGQFVKPPLFTLPGTTDPYPHQFPLKTTWHPPKYLVSFHNSLFSRLSLTICLA